ncbi:aspartyl-phosphate phosphatase Spo0E family protein [Sporomusa acidovorans]|uniref:Spo0E like sporulation regulatory protein n=1 Tax=Sporomusa acidovorans (strain ATCC 49682 / DSM 3132 / Mol) TaxID=1123286 RepID=A0ABZ3J3U9_SPOA4|nr:Spo0E like sporulation regulatory protein [Sporomusa acidovorans DSM 3132]SDF78793.1 Spo0E like sporulation regulatory protein [Sporomusa acidovorans]
MNNRQLVSICKKIEKLRSKMHNNALVFGVSHPKVLKVSQLLDSQISLYMKLCKSI